MDGSERFTAVVKRWRRESGELWQTNRLTRIIAPSLSMVNSDLLISQVQFDLDADNGERKTLTLAPREAFIVPTEAECQANSSDSVVDGLVRAWLN
ncbi:hypothetical protein D8L93_07460 [Sodalis-like symbiont of Bactericera trigonica]|nr:hypothetical protein D8L93_07460 [Sodalis-like symbiont of Bactericera trigonica]